MGSGKVLASVLAGAAAGAILGILFAPDKGTETRRKVSKLVNDVSDSIQDIIDLFHSEPGNSQEELIENAIANQ